MIMNMVKDCFISFFSLAIYLRQKTMTTCLKALGGECGCKNMLMLIGTLITVLALTIHVKHQIR